MHRVLNYNGVLNFQSETMHALSDIEGVKSWREQALHIGFQSADYGENGYSSKEHFGIN